MTYLVLGRLREGVQGCLVFSKALVYVQPAQGNLDRFSERFQKISIASKNFSDRRKARWTSERLKVHRKGWR